MNTWFIIGIAAVLLVLVLVVRFVVSLVIDKGADAINNKRIERKIKQSPPQAAKLSDIYREQSDDK